MIPASVDIAIVGGGLAGAALACALGNLNLRVALIEAQPLFLNGGLQWPELNDGIEGFDARVSALTESSRLWLEQLGAWQHVAARRISAYSEMEVWDGEGTGAIHFSAEQVNQPALGHIVENGLLQTALLHTLQTHRNVQILSPARVAHFEHRDAADKKQIAILFDGLIDNRKELLCDLLIGADGATSRVREFAGIETREWDYGHTAIVCTVATEKSHGATARQIFRREGPLALLPLRTANGDENFCSIVWSTLREEAEAGRVPCLRAGTRLLFDLEALRRLLLERAAQAGGEVRRG